MRRGRETAFESRPRLDYFELILFIHSWESPIISRMSDTLAKPELLRSLGRLVRGLSALFWGLPAALLICVETARAEWLKPLGILPALGINALLFYGLHLLGDFQKQERPWRTALDRAKILSLVNLGLCPFIFWHNRMPAQPFFSYAVMLLTLSALLFLFNLNHVLLRLGAMLPDETLRLETRQFTALNRLLLTALLFFAVVSVIVAQLPDSSIHGFHVWQIFIILSRFTKWILIFFALLPLAMTMALIWKTKEVILDSVFGNRN
jgi:hypothetical protein